MKSSMVSKASLVVAGVAASLLTVTAVTMFLSGPDCEFEISHGPTLNLRFSPDGKYIAIGDTNSSGPNSVTCVFRIADHRAMLQVDSEHRECAWSDDGTTLAVYDASHRTFELLDTKDWSKRGDAEFSTDLTSLCFDRFGNMYAVPEPPVGDWPSPPFDYALVWWNETPDLKATRRVDTISTNHKSDAFSISAASTDEETMLAISTTAEIELLRVRYDSAGSRTIERESTIAISEPAFVRLSSHGKQLAVLQRSRFIVYRIHEGNPTLRYSKTTPSETVADREMLIQRQLLDISRNGQFAAYCLGHQTTVIHLDDGKELLKLNKAAHAIALSPDGTFLAVSHVGDDSVCFYRINANQPTHK